MTNVLALLCLGLVSAVGDGKPERTEDQPVTIESLAAQLRESKPDRRRSAVRGLARLGGVEAWRLVLDALGDEDSRVGDAAELALERLVEPELVEELIGRRGLAARDERVGLRAAEAIGRLAVEVEGGQLVRRLSTRDAEASRRLVWSIERLARAERLVGRVDRVSDVLVSLAKGRAEIELACAALCALGAVDPERARKLALDELDDRSTERRCAALATLADTRAPEAFAAGAKLVRDDDPRVRMAAVECLASVSTRAAMLVLIARLAEEPRLRVRWRIVDVLRRASGLVHRLDPRPWKLWAEALPEDGVLRRMDVARPTARDGQRVTRAGGFAGLQLVSDRVAFLFDFSGSMWTPIEDGRVPKDVVAEKLRAALEALPESTEFNLIPFTNDPLPWESELRPAKQAEVRRALDYFEGCRARGRGNFYDAALLAMSDPKVDTIVVLTDGVPTGGLHSDMDLIVPLLSERTRYRKLVIDTILVDAPYGAKRRWDALAERTGGRCIEIELATPEPPK